MRRPGRRHQRDRSGTGTTRVLVQRADWNRMDGMVWTPWRTSLPPKRCVPNVCHRARSGRSTGARRPALRDGPAERRDGRAPGARREGTRGIRFDRAGNVYGISETAPTTQVGTPPRPRPGGYIFKFTPDRRGDLSSGQLYALKIVNDFGDRTGEAIWLPLDRQAVQVDADAAATAAGATGYARPEDVETATSTGNDRNPGENLYVAVTDESRVLRIDLREPGGANQHDTAFVTDYVRQGVNAPADFSNPDNLALDKNGNLFITEDTTTPPGMDIWVAVPNQGQHETAAQTVRFASLTDCGAEPSGLYFDKAGTTLFVKLDRSGPDF